MTEVWKPVPSAPQWEASSEGRVRRIPQWSEARKRFYGGKPQAGARSRAKLKVRDAGKNYSVARMVCEAFNGPAPADRPHCLHADENLLNNRPENLRWGTHTENMRAPGLRAWWTPERYAEARRKGWETRRQNQETVK